jgi:hypothetical protein
VLKRRVLAFYSAEASWGFRLRAVVLPLMLFYTRRVYRRLARHIANQVDDYLASGFKVLGIIGVDGSPSCGVQTTMNMEGAFVGIARMHHAATAVDVNAIVRSTAIPGRGLLVALIQEELTRRGVQVPFAAHDLLAELEGRQDTSAINALTAMAHGEAA